MTTCKVIKPGHTYEGKQEFTYFAGISAENTGSTGLCMHMLKIPPGGRAKCHYHAAHETAIYVIDGPGYMYFGEQLEEHVQIDTGEYLYIPPGVPHLPYNPSDTKTIRAVIARTDPNEQESVVLTPELESIHFSD